MALQLAPRIVVDPAIRFGRPIIQGTRVPVDLVLTKLAAGMTAIQIADDYDLASEDIQAVLVYAGSFAHLQRRAG
jgi:uncharacterized protein (DUF433 family)